MSIERLGSALPETRSEQADAGESAIADGTGIASGKAMAGGDVGPPRAAAISAPGSTDEAVEFVRFCYRRRSVAWPELYDEMCAVAAREEFRGMGYEQLESHGIGLALQALPKLAAMAASVIAEERRATLVAATA